MSRNGKAGPVPAGDCSSASCRRAWWGRSAMSRRSWPRSAPSNRRGLPDIPGRQPVGFQNSANQSCLGF